MLINMKSLIKNLNILINNIKTILVLPKINEKNSDINIENTFVKLKQLQAELEADHEKFFSKTEVLSEKDFALIGKMIQIYSSSDFNARRTINAIRKARLVKHHKSAGLLQDKQLYEALEEAVRSLPSGNLKDGLIKAAKTIAMHHQRRHDFAHWIFRKVPNEPVYYFCSNDERKLADRSGVSIVPGQARYGLMPIPEMVMEIGKLAGHCEYLAHSAVRLELGHDELKAHYDKEQNDASRTKYDAAKARTDKRGA